MAKKQKIRFKKTKRLLIFLLIIVVFYQSVVRIGYDSNRKIQWGMAYSKLYSQEIGVDWRKVYVDMIDDLGVKKVRLPFYWNDIEKEDNVYSFSDYDWMMDYARDRGVEVLPVVGKRLPRWPECHEPKWVKNLEKTKKDQALLDWLRIVVEHYKKYDNIKIWQVENEPFLTLFGDCEKPDSVLLDKEISLVRSLDNRPILVTDSGELSPWIKSSMRGDFLGTTVYRVVYNPVIGYWSYWFLPASLYRFKARLNLKNWDKMMVSELQAEPWYPNSGSVLTTPLDEQFKSMNTKKLEDHIKYAQKIGFPKSYLWGVEWWWWLKEIKGNDSMWKEGKKLFQ